MITAGQLFRGRRANLLPASSKQSETLLAYGKSASKGARPGSCAERLGVGASFCMQVTVARTRGTARVGCAPSPRASPPAGGARRPCPHPLKGHRPLRIPSAAALISQRSTHAPSGLLPRRRGYGGPCRTRSRAHRPLRIPSATALISQRPTHASSGLLLPSAGLRRALPAPAQGPSALENPLRYRAHLATPHPRLLRASPPVGGATAGPARTRSRAISP